MLQLEKEMLLGQGRQKTVYHHPENKGLCIKFSKQGCKRSLKREIKYIRKHQQKFHSISAYRGTVNTNLGSGDMFDLIRDADGQISMSLEEFMKTDYNRPDLNKKIAHFYDGLLANRAALSELQPCNILVKKDSSTHYDLVIIDGFGNSDFLKVCDISRYFLRKKLHRKFLRFCRENNIPIDFLK